MVHRITRASDGVGWRFHASGDLTLAPDVTRASARSSLPGPDKNDDVAVAAQMTRMAQNAADTAQPIADLPDEDPDKTVDPNRPAQFWANAQGDPVATHDGAPLLLIGREDVLTITYDPATDDFVPQTRRV